MKIRNYLSILPILSIMVSCSNDNKQLLPENKLAKANWVIGQWHNTSAEGVLTENWVQQNDSVLYGETFFVVGGKDTVFSEVTQIAQQGEELFYIPTVSNQNNGLPVYFKLTKATDSVLVFENPEHDFPQKITYTLVNKDSLVAEVSGVAKGEPKSEIFAMGRVK